MAVVTHMNDVHSGLATTKCGQYYSTGGYPKAHAATRRTIYTREKVAKRWEHVTCTECIAVLAESKNKAIAKSRFIKRIK